MTTIYVTCDQRFIMSDALFAAGEVLQRNREKFLDQIHHDAVIVSGDAFDILLGNKPFLDRPTMLVSEELFRMHAKTGDRFVEWKGVVIFDSYQTALSKALSDYRHATLLGGPRLFEEAVRRGTIDRMFLVHVEGSFEGTMHFPVPIKDSFDFVCQDHWESDDKNPYRAICQTYWRK